jgi:hypothetical protein
LLVNDSRLLVPYRQACLWLDDGGVTALSGVVETDRNTPYAQWLHGVCQFLQAQQPIQVRRIEPAQLPPELASSWSEWLGPYAVWVPLLQDGQKPVPKGGLLLSGRRQLKSSALRFSPNGVISGFMPILHCRQASPDSGENLRHRESTPKAGGKKSTWILGGLFVLGAVPVHMSVLAPGELVLRSLWC